MAQKPTVTSDPVDGSACKSSRRIDQWLWFARFFKTRTLASHYVAAGHIRLTRNGGVTRIEKPNTSIMPGDQLAFMLGPHLKIIEIVDKGERRGPAREAQQLYEDLSPPTPPKPERAVPVAGREPGTGRPTKKERRAIDALKP